MIEEPTSSPEAPVSSFDPKDSQALVAFFTKAPRPVSFDAMAEELGAAEEQRSTLHGTLTALLDDGTIVETRDGLLGFPGKMNLVVGILQCHEKGFGFVVPRDRTEDDLYIPRRKLGEAMHGDLVVARREATRKHKTEGRVIRTLKRARTQVVGRFEKGEHFGYVVPLDPRIGYQVYVPETHSGEAENDQLVCAEITSYPGRGGRRNPEGKVVEILGDVDDPRLDVEIIIREFNLAHEFPPEVLAEAEGIATEVREEDLEGRTDFRELPVVTIDGASAKDFDDAVYVEKLSNGNFKLSVHIADVSAYVPVGSAIDREAYLRATSVYFPDRVVPMLPEKLSNEICSLKPGVDRLVQTVEMEITAAGRTVNYEFHDGVIRSAERMTYKDVATLLEGSDEELNERYKDHIDHFRRMSDLCTALRKYRSGRGSIDFDLPEPEMLIDLRGEVKDVVRSERNLAHRIIEEFMIRTNEIVASHLIWEDIPSLYRVHEGPDPERVEAFQEFISGLGLNLGGGERPSSGDFQRLVEHLEGQPGAQVIIYLMLRTMKQARYQPDNIGHFGLASQRYTHYTSPIRRYPDLIVHRILKVDVGSKTQAEFDFGALLGELPRIGVQSSEHERTAEEAERRYVSWKKVQFMADKVGDSFEAFITGVHAYGFFVELDRYFVEGLVPVSDLGDDYYQYDERQHTLRGENVGRTFTLGNRVKVNLVRVDKERRRLDFMLEEGPLETGIKPLAAAPSAEQADADGDGGRGRKRRRRRSRKPASKGAASDETGAETPSADEGQPAAEEGGEGRAGSGGNGRKRSSRSRRGSRRGKAQSGGDEGRAAADGEGPEKRTRRRSAKSGDERNDKRGGRRSAKADGDAPEKQTRRRSAKSGDSRDGGGSRAKKSTARKTDGKKTTSRKPAGRKSGARKTESTAAATTSKSTEAPVEKPKDDKQQPRVNPYLTDL